MLAQRRRLTVIVAAATLVVLAVGFVAARWLTTENRERDAIFALLQQEARGDVPGALRTLKECDPGCQATVRA